VNAIVGCPRRFLQVGDIDDVQLLLGQEFESLREHFTLVSIE
jgi:hypothetical protein